MNETAVLLENQKKMNESPEEVGEFKRISIPLVRRIYPQLIASKICGVQPLAGPSSLVYYLRDKYTNQPIPVPVPSYRTIDDPWQQSRDW